MFSPDGSLLAFAFSSPVEPHDVYLYDLDARELTRLTTSPRDVDPATLVEPTLHRFESFDGESRAGLPLRAGGRRAVPRRRHGARRARRRSGARGSRRASRR